MSPPCVGNKRIYLWIAGTPDETSMCPRESRNVGAMRVQGRDVHRRTSEVVGEGGYQKKRGRERICKDEEKKG